MYKDEDGKVKGDAVICYLRKESIPLAIQMQDDMPLRYSLEFVGYIVTYSDKTAVQVSEAQFTKKQDNQ